MSYRQRWKQRKLKQTVIRTLQLFQFKSENLSFAGKIVLFWSIVMLASLFFPWVVDTGESSLQWNAFTTLVWNLGFPLLFLFFVIIFLLFSQTKKERLKLHTNISFQNYAILLNIGLFVVLSGIISLSFINGLKTFEDTLIYGNGIILSICSGIILCYGSILLRKEYKNSNIETFISDTWELKERIIPKNNMKLPF
jgi:hypothetical protein